MQHRLGRWAADTLGPDTRVDGLERMPGHSGITWAFEVGGEQLVLRTPPLGARRSAATDVHRQAPLLTAARGLACGDAARGRRRPLAEAVGRDPEPSWIPAGRTLHARLRAAVPDVGPPGLVHADFYANNWMVDGGDLVAVLDWEGAHRGDARVDVGWIAMIYDRESWHPAQRPDIAAAPEPEDLVAAYGAPLRGVAWFRALAGMRLAALTAHYLRMHRTGQRPDATWEAFGESVPYILGRAVAVLG